MRTAYGKGWVRSNVVAWLTDVSSPVRVRHPYKNALHLLYYRFLPFFKYLRMGTMKPETKLDGQPVLRSLEYQWLP